MPLPIAFSPCPNDTFLFHAWATGLVGKEMPIIPTLADVQHLNEGALKGIYPISKVSIYTAGLIRDYYVLLPTGCALGHSCGPKIIAKKPFTLSQMGSKRIAIPGIDTTAHLLFNVLIEPAAEKIFCRYDEVTELVRSGIVDCGLIIHETRFTFERDGFVEIADLGAIWEQRYALPLPLGGIVAKRSLGQETLTSLNTYLQASLRYARQHPHASMSYILEHSMEKDPQVVQQHIDLYVNDETANLSAKGQAAIDTLFRLGQERHLLPTSSQHWLFEEPSCYSIH